MRPRSSLAPHSGAAVQTHSQLTVDAPPTGTTAPSTAQGALWMVLASGAVGVAYGTFFWRIPAISLRVNSHIIC